MNTKWVWIILLLIVGVVAAVFAFEYLSYSNYALPTWMPGNEHGHLNHVGKAVKGNHNTRGYAAAAVAVLAFAGAGWMIYKEQLTKKSAAPTAPAESTEPTAPA